MDSPRGWKRANNGRHDLHRRKMNATSFFLALVIVFALPAIADISEERKRELLEPYLEEKPINIHVLAEEERLFLLETVRRRRVELFEANEATLFDLGDPEWTEKMVGVWNAGDSYDTVLIRAGRPDIIPLVIPSLLKEEPYFHEFTDVEIRPHSVITAGLIKAIVARSPAFSPETISWAQGLLPQSDQADQEFREIMRAWWKENKPFFEAKDYKSVRPGRALSSSNESDALNDSPSGPRTPLTPTAAVSTQANPVRSAADSATPPTGVLLAVAAAILAILFLAWRWARQRC
jgi:hypothetical protein